MNFSFKLRTLVLASGLLSLAVGLASGLLSLTVDLTSGLLSLAVGLESAALSAHELCIRETRRSRTHFFYNVDTK